ncbi:O-methyltransferas-like protein [Coleophoma crateriformis]|uniref:O-methyltransferas-like protein n=1 Tax=Coleophoma crateriformis TaxID=565419 RepID=A0A3D8QYB4_9HELO|nr:O-methyltransferas-like protein [Coleophoma crateriformis]
MKENYTALYPNEQVATAVGDYAFKHSTALPQHITEYHTIGSSHEKANYMISPLQAQFQLWMAKALGTKRILEIGVFIGFSTMAWSEAVGPTGHVTGLEFSPEYAAEAKKAWSARNISNIEIIVGDAKESLQTLSRTLTEPYDLIFIDADKVSYPTYLSIILSSSKPSSEKRLLKKGGVIIADNILRRGLIADSSDANPYREKLMKLDGGLWRSGDMDALDKFNKEMVGNERLETFLMPMFDGLGMARLVD